MPLTRNVYRISSDKQIENFEELEKILIKYLYKNEERGQKLKKLIQDIEADFSLAPASPSGHGCYLGGLVEHILDVIPYMSFLRTVYESEGLEVPSFESCMFVSIFHDIGKVTDGDNPNYVPEDSDWHRKHYGRNFKIAENETGLEHCDKSLFLLQRYGVKMSIEEYQAIRIHDGSSYGGNQVRRYGYSSEISLLAEMLRIADMMAAQKREHLDLQAERRK